MGLKLLTQFGIASASPFSPDSISGLNVWFDVDDSATITSSAGKVSQILDKAGGNHLSQVVSVNQPTLETGTNDYLFFNGSHWLERDNSAGINNTVVNDMSAFIVKKDPFSGSQNNANPFYFNLSDKNNSESGYQLYRDSGSNQKYIVKASGSYVTDFITVSPLIQNNTPSLGTYIRNGQICTTQINITTTASDAGGSPGPIQFLTPSYAMGVAFGWGFPASQAPGNFLVGRIGEVIIYNRVLTTQEKSNVETYLYSKWGIT